MTPIVIEVGFHEAGLFDSMFRDWQSVNLPMVGHYLQWDGLTLEVRSVIHRLVEGDILVRCCIHWPDIGSYDPDQDRKRAMLTSLGFVEVEAEGADGHQAEAH